MPELSKDQKRVLDVPTGENVRILGAAGSGKTVALCLRSIKEVRASPAQGLRILFATHSWAMAERVDGSLRAMNAGRVPAEIEIWPLLQVLKDLLRGDYVGQVGVLGDDSTEGRAFQLEIIQDLVVATSPGDIKISEQQGLNEAIQQDLEAANVRSLAENLYQEFNGVLLPNGIRPGDSKKIEKYINDSRSDDMPPFVSKGDRLFVLNIYKKFLEKLQEWGMVTNDQLVSDAIRVLETFSWDVKRQTSGFDVIYVDELQLFDAQERMALTLLARDPRRPVFVTAEDPSQGVFSTVSPAWRTGAVNSNKTPIELSTAHRFNQGILSFIKHLYLIFPLNTSALSIEAREGIPEGDAPIAYELNDSNEMSSILAKEVKRLHSKGGRLAVITLSYDAKEISEKLQSTVSNVVLVDSLDDIERLSYQKRSVVVGNWGYLGGTQFENVIVVGKRLGAANTAFEKMKDLISLYVGCSRASSELVLLLSEGLPEAVTSAVGKGLLRLHKL